jgi:hypothetical protein
MTDIDLSVLGFTCHNLHHSLLSSIVTTARARKAVDLNEKKRRLDGPCCFASTWRGPEHCPPKFSHLARFPAFLSMLAPMPIPALDLPRPHFRVLNYTYDARSGSCTW